MLYGEANGRGEVSWRRDTPHWPKAMKSRRHFVFSALIRTPYVRFDAENPKCCREIRRQPSDRAGRSAGRGEEDISEASHARPGRLRGGSSRSALVVDHRWGRLRVRRVLGGGPGCDIDEAPGTGAYGPDSPRHPPASHPDDEVAHWPDQQQQPQGIADKPGYADQDPGGQYDHSIEQPPARNVALSQPVLGTSQHPEPNPLDQERAQSAHSDQDENGPAEPDVLADRHERRDLRHEEEASAEQKHPCRVPPVSPLVAAVYGGYPEQLEPLPLRSSASVT